MSFQPGTCVRSTIAALLRCFERAALHRLNQPKIFIKNKQVLIYIDTRLFLHYLLVAVVSLCRCAGAPPFVCQAKTAPRKAVVRRYRRRARRKHSGPPRAPPDAGEAWHHCCSKVCSSCWQRHFGMQQCLARAPSKVLIHFRLRGLPLSRGCWWAGQPGVLVVGNVL